VSDGSTFTSDDLADDYERHYSAGEPIVVDLDPVDRGEMRARLNECPSDEITAAFEILDAMPADEYERLMALAYIMQPTGERDMPGVTVREKLAQVEQDLILANRAHNSAALGRMEAEREVAELRRAMRNLGEKYNELSAKLENFKARHTAAGCGMDATTGSLHIMTTGVGLINDVIPPDRVEDGEE